MDKHKVYISASTQSKNVGVGEYGTEQDRMQTLADMVAGHLQRLGSFEVFRNRRNMTLKETVDDCNAKSCALFVDNHSNAGPIEQGVDGKGAEGTEVFYKTGSTSGKKIADLLYTYIAPVSPGGDRGSKKHDQLYVLNTTRCPAALIEHVFHTNHAEVRHILQYMEQYAKAEAQAICYYFGVHWLEPDDATEELVAKLKSKQVISDTVYWTKVLKGEFPADPKFLKVIFERIVS